MGMLRRSRRGAGILGLAVVAAVAVVPTQPASAAPEPAARPSDARQRMLAQRPLVDAATAVRAAVERSGADGLASIVIEKASVTVWWKGEPPAPVAAAVRRARATAPVRVAEARFTIAELRTASARLERRLRTDARFHGIKARPDGSGLIVKVTEDGPATLAAVPDVGVPTTVSVEPRMRPVARGDDSSPWSGGAEIVNTSIGAGCTAGFGVDTPDGPAILTAGHCGDQGNRFTDGAGEFIGNVGEVNKNFDVMIIPTNAVTNRIYIGGGNSTQQLRVTGGGAPFVGEIVCQSGNTSANQVGGPVCNIRVQAEGTDSQRLWEAEQLDGRAAARPGDSGGPVYDDRGDGTVIARGTSTYITGINGFGFAGFEKAERDFGVSIPGGGGPGPGGGVVFFEHIDFDGSASQALAPGRYTLADLEARGLGNDSASSARVPDGRTVIMFEHDDFQGTRWTLDSDTPNFLALQPNANDEVSSVIVE